MSSKKNMENFQSYVSQLANVKNLKLSGNSIEDKRKEILEYFHKSFSLYEELFTFINEDAYYVRAEPLRHPLIFYYGHTATFVINKLIVSGFKIKRINPYFESIFAVGVDEMSWDDLNTEHYNWPSVSQVREYRNQVRAFFDNFVKQIEFTLPITWENPLWVSLMIVEHEKIHLETSSVIMRMLSLNFFINQEKAWRVCEEANNDIDYNIENEFIAIEGNKITLGKNDDFYGWDNEYGTLNADVKDFSVSKYLTTNKEYLEFIKAGGYLEPNYWTEEGKRWLRFQTLNRPIFWSEDYSKLRLFNKEIEMPWDWPVEVNYLEAKAYCNWKTSQTGIYTRLLTEPEWYILRGDNELNANIDLKYYSSSCPVNKFKHNFGIYDIIGNVWQWTESVIDGFPGFQVHNSYKDFSTPTFDGKHNLIKGGSWISTGNLSIIASRYAFRRHFYQHAGFRCVRGEEVKSESILIEREPEVAKWISAEYDSKTYQRFDFQPFSQTVAEEVKKIATEEFSCEADNIDSKRILVLGCKTGGLCFQLAESFAEVTGMDQTAYYFKVAVDLKEGNIIRYIEREEGELLNTKEIEFNSKRYQDSGKRIDFYQTDLYNEIDTKKHGKFDVILIANVDDLDTIYGVSMKNILKDHGLVFIMIPKGKQLKEMQFPNADYKKLNMIQNTLTPNEHKILFKETARKHRLEIYEMQIFKFEKRKNADDYYESDFLCEQYIRLHYANEKTFPNLCGKVCLEYLQKLNIPECEYKNALDLGCALGQTAIYLANKFKEIYAVDYSQRFIEIAKERVASLEIKNVNFLNGSVLELKKFENIPKDNTLVFCGNLIDRLYDPKVFLADVGNYIKQGGLLILTSPYTWLEQFTPRENWIGGIIKNGEIINTLTGLEHILKDNFDKVAVEDIHFLIPDFPPFSHQLTAAELSVWKKK